MKGVKKMEDLIVVQNVEKSFRIYEKESGFINSLKSIIKPIFKDIKAVENVDFTIKRGDIVGYIGPNGAGKSTTIKMLTGILTPTNGEIKVFNKNPIENRKEISKKIGVVFGQKSQLWWDVPVIESFKLLKEIFKISSNDFNQRIEMYTDLLNMKELLKIPVRQLSLGQRMKCDLVASLLHDPEILFLDEPTIGLDVATKDILRTFIKKMNLEKKITVFLTTHDMQDVEKLCNRIILINKGKKVYDGDILDVKEKYISHRILKVQFDKYYNISDLFCLMKYENLIIEDLDNYYKIFKFDYKKYSVADIIGELMKNYKIIDFSSSELAIEDVIKQIS